MDNGKWRPEMPGAGWEKKTESTTITSKKLRPSFDGSGDQAHLASLIVAYWNQFTVGPDDDGHAFAAMGLAISVLKKVREPKSEAEILERINIILLATGITITQALEAYTELYISATDVRDILSQKLLSTFSAGMGIPVIDYHDWKGGRQLEVMLVSSLATRDRLMYVRADLIARNGLSIFKPSQRQVALYHRYLFEMGEGSPVTLKNAIGIMATWGLVGKPKPFCNTYLKTATRDPTRKNFRRDLEAVLRMAGQNQKLIALINRDLRLS